MLTVTDLYVSLGGTEILHGIELAVEPGEWVTVIGPNGAGKSTLLRAVGGQLRYRGSITLGDQQRGTALAALSRRQRAKSVATVAQQPIVPLAMRVVDYVLLGRYPHIPPLGRESVADLAVVADVLSQLDLAGFDDRALDTLSGGERQRVFLARALVQDAPVLLLDEPTSALDIGHQQEVLELVDRLRISRGLTVLATMHDLSVAGEYADRIVLLASGRVAASGSPALVLTEDLLAEHYRARVKVIPGAQGPIVVPVRL